MAQIVLGIGSSHTPMLFTRPEDWPKYEQRDRQMELLDHRGRVRSFDALAAEAGPEVSRAVQPWNLQATYETCQRRLDRLADTITKIEPDAVIVIGDDQKELFLDDNLPSMLVYWGPNLVNAMRERQPGEPEWWSEALAGYYGRGRDELFPVDSGLALHLIHHLMEAEFDVAQSKKLPRGRGEGHAFAFVHARLLQNRPIPVVPIFLNTYYPPNQPTPQRCYDLGRAIRSGLEGWNPMARVCVIASGGLSHFVVDPSLDSKVINALQNKDVQTLTSLPTQLLNSGTSEIRNWIVMFGATEHLSHEWIDYLPCYRTTAGTGTGCAFGVFR